MVTFYLPLGYILQVVLTAPPPHPTPWLHAQTHSNRARERKKKKNLGIYKSVIPLSHMLIPVWEDIAAIQVRLLAFLQTDRYTDGEKEGGEEGGDSERGSSPPLSSLHPAVSAFLLSPPAPIPRLPLGIECSQSGRWAECIIHRLLWGWGAGGVRACVRTKSWGSRPVESL